MFVNCNIILNDTDDKSRRTFTNTSEKNSYQRKIIRLMVMTNLIFSHENQDWEHTKMPALQNRHPKSTRLLGFAINRKRRFI